MPAIRSAPGAFARDQLIRLIDRVGFSDMLSGLDPSQRTRPADRANGRFSPAARIETVPHQYTIRTVSCDSTRSAERLLTALKVERDPR
jgi:hypothetical protein